MLFYIVVSVTAFRKCCAYLKTLGNPRILESIIMGGTWKPKQSLS